VFFSKDIKDVKFVSNAMLAQQVTRTTHRENPQKIQLDV